MLTGRPCPPQAVPLCYMYAYSLYLSLSLCEQQRKRACRLHTALFGCCCPPHHEGRTHNQMHQNLAGLASTHMPISKRRYSHMCSAFASIMPTVRPRMQNTLDTLRTCGWAHGPRQ